MFSKRIPLRTCIGCGLKANKRNFIRLVKVSPEFVTVDTDEAIAGRGVYLCNNPSCWENAFKGNRLEKAIRAKMLLSDQIQLKEKLRVLHQGLDRLEEKVG